MQQESQLVPSQQPASAEALEALTTVKAGLDREAIRRVSTMVWFSFGILFLVIVSLAFLTYKYGWDKMEPWTYFIGLTVTLGGYGYFAVTNRELAPNAIYEQLIATQKQKLYRKLGFDLVAYESLCKSITYDVTFPNQQDREAVAGSTNVRTNLVGNGGKLEELALTISGVNGGSEANQNIASGIVCKEDERVTTLSVSSNGKYLAYGGFARRVLIFSLESLTRTEVTMHKETVRSVRFAPLRNAVASSADDGVLRLDYLDEKEFRVIGKHAAPVYCLAFHPRGKLIASASRDSFARIWDIEKSPIQKSGSEPRSGGHFIKSFKHREGSVFAVDFDHTGSRLATCGEKGAIYIWDIETQQAKRFTSSKETVFCVRFDPTGNLLASGGADSTVRVWDINTGECKILRGHNSAVRWVSFHPSGRLIASASKDRTIRLWEPLTLRSWILDGHTDYIYSVEFHSDGTRMYSAGGDGSVRWWNVPPTALTLIS